jgi:hypothetical protein
LPEGFSARRLSSTKRSWALDRSQPDRDFRLAPHQGGHMPSIPAGFAERLKKEYPNLSVRWNEVSLGFQVVEKFFFGAVPRERVIWEYENSDGTFLPFSQDHCMEFLHSIDTRKWSLRDRVRIWREEKRREEEARQKKIAARVHDHVTDNEVYFTSAERFFMDPTSMPEWKSKFMPSQERALKRLKAA